MPDDNPPGRYVPSIDQLVEFYQALMGFDDMREKGPTYIYFLERDEWKPRLTLDGPSLIETMEDKILPRFTRLADALRDVRPLIGKTEGWRVEVGRAIGFIAKEFEATTEAWRWGKLAEPSPARDAHEKTCREDFRRDVEDPFLKVVLSIEAGWTRVKFPFDFYADAGRRRGLRPTMTPEEGNVQLPEAKRLVFQKPRFGKCIPELKLIEQDSEASDARDVIKYALMRLVPDRVKEYDQGAGRPRSIEERLLEAKAKAKGKGKVDLKQIAIESGAPLEDLRRANSKLNQRSSRRRKN